jgi:hypothetical protein
LQRSILLAVGLLYLGLGVWCLLAPDRSAAAVGFELADASGRGEFLVVYGGLEIGLGLFFFRASRSDEFARAGFLLLFITSFCLAATRLATIFTLSDLRSLTYGLFATEVLLTAAGAFGLHATRSHD